MNSLDFLIAMIALLAGFAILVGAVNAQKEGLSESASSLQTRTNLLECSAIIDFIYANSADLDSTKTECFFKGTETVLGKKSIPLLTEVKVTYRTEVSTVAHYG